MSTARCLHYSYAEYLDALSMSELRLEYLNGDAKRVTVIRKTASGWEQSHRTDEFDLPGVGALAVSALYA